MISRAAKAAFYMVASPLMWINSRIYRSLRAPKVHVKAHLGPGQQKYLEGWINVDANIFTGKCDVWSDLRYPLPFRDCSVQAMYSHHMIEHLPDLRVHFADVYRCLAPGGIYRVAGPNGDGAIAKFVAGDKAWFSDFPDERRSVGGRFENFIFCRGEHLTILTQSFLQELMEDAGFVDVRLCQPVKESGNPQLFSDAMQSEWEDDYGTPHTLVLEGNK